MSACSIDAGPAHLAIAFDPGQGFHHLRPDRLVKELDRSIREQDIHPTPMRTAKLAAHAQVRRTVRVETAYRWRSCGRPRATPPGRLYGHQKSCGAAFDLPERSLRV